MPGPWEKYAAPPAAQPSAAPAGPWAKYQQSNAGAAQSESDVSKDTRAELSAMTQNPQTKSAYDGGVFSAATEGSQAGLMLGFDDEIAAGMLSPIDATIDWFKGEGFDIGKAYSRKQKMLDDQKSARRQEYPIASIAGEVAGGLALPGTGPAASTVVKPAGSTLVNIGKGALQGAGYGAVAGAGEARPSERLEGAAQGAAFGGLAGGALGGIGGALANRTARKAMPTAPAIDDLAAQSRALYDQAAQAGVAIKPKAVDRVVNNAVAVAGRINKDLRPNTAGVVDDLVALKGKPVSLEQLDELRQVVGQAMKRAQPQDVRSLQRIKDSLDNFATNAKPADITGDIRGFDHIKKARELWSRKAKTEKVEALLDLAEVDASGKYTQSGLANSIRQRSASLYRDIKKNGSQGFTADEVKLIRQMAAGGSNSRMINLLAKFAPRGVVSALAGPALGSTVGGVVGGVGLPLAGHVAGKMADKGALAAANTLRDAAARGYMLQPLLGPNKLAPLIPTASEASTGTLRTQLEKLSR